MPQKNHGKGIHRYKLKENITLESILSELKDRKIPHTEGGSYISDDAYYSFWHTLVDNIEVCVAIPKDISKWDDFEHVLVLDDSFCQPYTPFYSDQHFPYLLNVVGHYNKFMDSLDFLERSDT